MTQATKKNKNYGLNYFTKTQPYWVVFLTATFFLYSFINLNSFDALNENLRNFYQLDAIGISNLSALYFYANVIFMIPAGLLLDRYSTKKLVLTAFLISILSTLLFAWGGHLYTAMIARFLTGMMATFCLLSAAKLTSRWIPPKHAGFVMGGVITLAMIGGMLAQKLPNLTLIFNSWQKSISAVAILGLFFWLLILFFVQNAPKNQNQNKNPTSLQNTEQNTEHFNHRNKFYIIFFKALFNRQTWLSGIYSNFLSLPIILLGALWAKDYLITSYHETLNSAEYNISLIFLGVLIGCPLAGWISDRLKKRKAPMIIGAFLTLLTALFLITERTLSPLEIGLDFFLMGIFSGSQAITFALLIESNPLHSTALAESIGAMIIMSAGAIFQPLFGYLLERNWDGKMLGNTPLYTPANFHMALWILPITFAASVLIALFIKETHCKNMNL